MAKQPTSYDKARLAEYLKKLYEFTLVDSEPPEGHRRYKILGGSGARITFTSAKGTFEGVVPEGQGPTLVIYDDGMDALAAFVDEACKDKEIRDIVGRDAVEKQVQTILQSTSGSVPNEDLKDFVRFQVMKPLRDEIKDWLTFIPIVNLSVTASLQLGDVTFVDRKTAKDELRQFVEEHRFGGIDEADKDQQKQYILPEVDDLAQRCKAFAKVSVRSHSERVTDVAADKALVAINILRSHTHLFHSYDDKALIGLYPEIATGVWRAVSMNRGETHSFSIQSRGRGSQCEFVLDAQKVEHLADQCHLGLTQEMLDKPCESRTSLETALIQGFQALGRAVVAPTIDMRFLGCTIALERLLIRDGEETTTERWSDRLAVVLARNSDQRQPIIQEAKRLYDLRSRIVHAGYTGVTDADARKMEQWAVHAILSTLGRHKDFGSHEEFCKKIDPREIGLALDRRT